MEKLMDGGMDGWVDFRIAKHKICSGGEGTWWAWLNSSWETFR